MTNHIQLNGLAYCFLKNSIVEVPGSHVDNVCTGELCPFLSGGAQGQGIECEWDDGTGQDISWADPNALQEIGNKLHRKK